MRRFSPTLFRFFGDSSPPGSTKKRPRNTRFRSTWSDHNPGLLLAGSALVRDASALEIERLGRALVERKDRS